jgi:3-hydroxyisobutyrate dehydrogenase-like beta-hydroxyacid dehydrogenase
MANSAADSRFIREGLDALFAGDYMTDFGLDRCCEELDAVVRLAFEQDIPFELAGVVRDLYAGALEQYGPADGELLAVKFLEERSGVSLS